MKILTLSLLVLFTLPFMVQAEAHRKTYDEIDFVKTFAGKKADFVKKELGKPDAETIKKTNGGGTYQLWLYRNLVHQHNQVSKVYVETQIGIINNYVETLGNTNRPTK